jgi:hypothetical protein
LEQVVFACLAKKLEDRPWSVAELARLFAAADVKPWTSEQAAEWWATVRASSTGLLGSTDRTMTSG